VLHVTAITASPLPGWKNEEVDFEKLANQHKDAVYRQMLLVCGNREDAEDVLVEALLKAYRHLDQLRDQEAFRSWLAAIGKRVCWQLKERAALLPVLQLSSLEDDGRELPGHDADPEASTARRQMKQLLADAMSGLPEEYRLVYEMRDLQQLSGEEVAGKLGISISAMKSRLHRARKLVRDYLDQALAPASEAKLGCESPTT
jgi:RNA polymerase sigma-70 factor (ECF subfamily)